MTELNTRNIAKIILLVVIAVGLIWFFSSVIWVIGLFAISLFIVYALVPLVDYFKNRFRIPHGLSVGLAFLVFVGIIAILLIIIIPIAIQEIENVINDLPVYFAEIQRAIEDIELQLQTIDVDLDLLYLQESLPQILQNLQPALESVAHFSLDLASGLVNFFLIILIVFYLLYDFNNIRSNIISICPPKYREQAKDIMHIIDVNFGGYIRGTIARLFIVGIIVGVSMFFIGMPYAFLLGLFAGMMDIFPYIGPYIAAAPAVLLSLSPATPSILIVIIIFAIVQALESFVLSPLLLGKAVKIKPITVLVCLLTGQQLAGILGMILFVPIAGIIRSLIIYYQQKNETPEHEMVV